MLARHAATPIGVSQRASAMRRQRRRTSGHVPYCSTNGCATHLRLDPGTGIARCPICGFTRRLD